MVFRTLCGGIVFALALLGSGCQVPLNAPTSTMNERNLADEPAPGEDSPGFYVTNPSPTTTAIDKTSDLEVTWIPRVGAVRFVFSLYDLSSRRWVTKALNVSSSKTTVPKSKFYRGHEYLITVEAYSSTSLLERAQRKFKIVLAERQSSVDRAHELATFKWNAPADLGPYNGYRSTGIPGTSPILRGTEVQGVLYSKSAVWNGNFSSSTPNVAWSVLKTSKPMYYQSYELANDLLIRDAYFPSKAKFNNGADRDYGLNFPMFGLDCSSFVSCAWNTPNANDPYNFNSDRLRNGEPLTNVGLWGDVYDYSRLSPGDVLVTVDRGTANHVLMVKSLFYYQGQSYAEVYECGGKQIYKAGISKYSFTELSQKGYWGRTRSSWQQDYTWNWE